MYAPGWTCMHSGTLLIATLWMDSGLPGCLFNSKAQSTSQSTSLSQCIYGLLTCNACFQNGCRLHFHLSTPLMSHHATALYRCSCSSDRAAPKLTRARSSSRLSPAARRAQGRRAHVDHWYTEQHCRTWTRVGVGVAATLRATTAVGKRTA